MNITICSNKGGVAKTTTAIHLAAWLHQHAPTMLIDADANRSALKWSKAGDGLSFPVVDQRHAHLRARDFKNIVIDTEGGIDREDLTTLAEGCDLMILPTTPDGLALRGLSETISVLREIPKAVFRVLLTIIPPEPSPDEANTRRALDGAGVPLFAAGIPRLVAFKRASEEGCIVQAVRDKNAARAWQSYVDFSQEAVRWLSKS